MSKVIRVDREVYQAIQDRAIPLKDKPNLVLRRVFGLDPKLSDEDEKKTKLGQKT